MFKESFRVLKKGGRLAISNVVATIELPQEMRNDLLLIAGYIGNASLIDDVQNDLNAAGFSHIRIKPKEESCEFIQDWVLGKGVEDYAVFSNNRSCKTLINNKSTTME